MQWSKGCRAIPRKKVKKYNSTLRLRITAINEGKNVNKQPINPT